ncbi:MAG TPA: hypothetical protein VL181_00790 [Holophagaceae bacterium]|nr:hypothetical protein [Holophagaceae bacterium]
MTRPNALSALIPAGVLLLLPALGCDSKTSVAEAPLAAQTPQDILQHLRYLSASKDYKHIILMAPVSADVVFPSAWWFHSQAAGLGLQLTDQEMQDLGVTGLKDKLDNLPRYPVPGYDIQDARRAFYAGIYRLVKGFSTEEWNKMYVISVQPSADQRLTVVTLGFDSQPKIAVSCVKTAEGTYGVANLEYKVGLARKK